jgi:hypothetical protein
MRIVCYKDKLIKPSEYNALVAEYTNFIKDTTGIDVTFWTIDYDFTDYPTIIDTDGDDVLRPNFLQNIAKEVTAKYGDYGTDNVVTLIHERNWKSGKAPGRKGIWGTNYSYKYGKYHIQYCRFDEGGLINSFGTLNHEIDHTFDALCQVEVGINLNPILGVTKYDADTTHGGKPPYKYIRNDENADKLKVIAPYLASAYKKRLERHIDAVKGKQLTIIGLLEKLVYLYKQRLNKK